jgi:outer membrane protein TolC
MGRSPRELFQQLLSQAPIPLSDALEDTKFPPGLEAAVMKALSRQPNDRQDTVEEFAAQLEAGLAEAPEAPRQRGILGALRNFVGKRGE